ncbi:MAG: phosphoglycerate kinase [Chitinivibrionales bacterium]|nr:phosphoglycerate kinase [Chitinivibrionales bacterium]
MAKLFIEDLAVSGKRVLVRVDFNVPLDKKLQITSDERIVESMPTISYLSNHGARVILMSHLGRPKGGPAAEFSLKPVADYLSRTLPNKVFFVQDCIGPKVEEAVARLTNGQILLLENLRFYKEEEKNDTQFAQKLAKFGDIYINDAFGTAHRGHASTEGVTHYMKQSAAGYLMKKELDFLGAALEKPKRPFVAILGGAKISGKIEVISNLMNKVDTLLIGGGMVYTFFKAQGLEIGKSLLEADKVDLAKQILAEAKAKKVQLLLPTDNIVANEFTNDAEKKLLSVKQIPADMLGMDIGPQTIELFSAEIEKAKTIVWNGPLGVFEFDNFAAGTIAIAQSLAKATKKGATTIIGGGDSASAIAKAGLKNSMTHISTGGGASLEFLEGKVLPGVAALTEK